MKKYNLALVFFPQDSGGYTVVCPELHGCISEGGTYDEAEKNIKALIPDFLAKELEDDADCDLFAPGLTLPGKIFREIEVEA
jgi:predicted RNase H-like HicB family nuclease